MPKNYYGSTPASSRIWLLGGFSLRKSFQLEHSPSVWNSLVLIGVGKQFNSARYNGETQYRPRKTTNRLSRCFFFTFFFWEGCVGCGVDLFPIHLRRWWITSVLTPHPMFHRGKKDSYLQAMAFTKTFLQDQGPDITTIVCMSCISRQDILCGAMSTYYQDLSLRVPNPVLSSQFTATRALTYYTAKTSIRTRHRAQNLRRGDPILYQKEICVTPTKQHSLHYIILTFTIPFKPVVDYNSKYHGCSKSWLHLSCFCCIAKAYSLPDMILQSFAYVAGRASRFLRAVMVYSARLLYAAVHELIRSVPIPSP